MSGRFVSRVGSDRRALGLGIAPIHSAGMESLRGVKEEGANWPVLISSSFPVPHHPTAQVGLRLRRYSGKTPATPAPARKRCARPHSAGEIVPARDRRRPPPGESGLPAVQAVVERYRSRTLEL